MDIIYYNAEVELILENELNGTKLKNQAYDKKDLTQLIDYVSSVISMYDQLSKETQLKEIVGDILKLKFKKNTSNDATLYTYRDDIRLNNKSMMTLSENFTHSQIKSKSAEKSTKGKKDRVNQTDHTLNTSNNASERLKEKVKSKLIEGSSPTINLPQEDHLDYSNFDPTCSEIKLNTHSFISSDDENELTSSEITSNKTTSKVLSKNKLSERSDEMPNKKSEEKPSLSCKFISSDSEFESESDEMDLAKKSSSVAKQNSQTKSKDKPQSKKFSSSESESDSDDQIFISAAVLNIIKKTHQHLSDEESNNKTKVVSASNDFFLTEKQDQYKESNTKDRVLIMSAGELISRKFEYPHRKFLEELYKGRDAHVAYLKALPQPEQKSDAWFKMRNECLTATAIAAVINEASYDGPHDILLDKCGKGKPFTENIACHHGKKYESVANEIYCFRNNIYVDEYGLLIHPQYSFIGASPDGICTKKRYQGDGLSTLVGRLLEIKCPLSRVIKTEGTLDGDICPHYYWVQVQIQEEVTNLDECDFLQCRLEEYEDRKDFLEDTHSHTPSLSKTYNLEKGAIIQLFPKNKLNWKSRDINRYNSTFKDKDYEDCLFNAKFLYPPRMHMTPKELDEWIAGALSDFHQSELAQTYVFDRVIYWKLVKVACHLIKRDKNWFASKLPIIEQFWEYVKFFRSSPDELENLIDYIQDVERGTLKQKRAKIIFSYVHKRYLKKNPHTRFPNPLYQEEVTHNYYKKH
jgi:putative phage-type endonuclease